MTLYEMNKQIYKQYKPYDSVLLNQKMTELGEAFKDVDYILLLCKELSDYTFFLNQTYAPAFSNELLETLHNRGEVLSIEKKDDQDYIYEIWMKMFDGEVHCYHLFDCGGFVVEVKL